MYEEDDEDIRMLSKTIRLGILHYLAVMFGISFQVFGMTFGCETSSDKVDWESISTKRKWSLKSKDD